MDQEVLEHEDLGAEALDLINGGPLVLGNNGENTTPSNSYQETDQQYLSFLQDSSVLGKQPEPIKESSSTIPDPASIQGISSSSEIPLTFEASLTDSSHITDEAISQNQQVVFCNEVRSDSSQSLPVNERGEEVLQFRLLENVPVINSGRQPVLQVGEAGMNEKDGFGRKIGNVFEEKITIKPLVKSIPDTQDSFSSQGIFSQQSEVSLDGLSNSNELVQGILQNSEEVVSSTSSQILQPSLEITGSIIGQVMADSSQAATSDNLNKAMNQYQEESNLAIVTSTSGSGDEEEKKFLSAADIDDEVQVKQEARMAKYKNPQTCPICGKVSRDNYDARRHLNTHNRNVGDYKCQHCRKAFVTRSDCARHEKTHTGVRNVQCPECDMKFMDKSSMQKHFQRIHTEDKPWVCCECERAFFTRGELQTHLRQKHTLDRPFPCAYCDKSFAQRSTLKTHMKQHLKIPESVLKGEEQHVSVDNLLKEMRQMQGQMLEENIRPRYGSEEEDGQLFIEDKENDADPIYITIGDDNELIIADNEDGLSQDGAVDEDGEILHVTLEGRQHSNDEVLILNEQEANLLKYQTKDNEKEMLYITLDPEQQAELRKAVGTELKCTTCGKSFTDKEKLCDHVRNHIIDDALVSSSILDETTEDRVFSCMQCDDIFNDLNALRKHISATHGGTLKQKCDLCGKRFMTKEDLHQHEQSQHSTGKPFACWQCGKSFSNKGGLRTHLFTHLEVKPHACTECMKTFSTNAQLTLHMRMHTGEKPFKCSKCPKAYRMKASLTYHEFAHAVKDHDLSGGGNKELLESDIARGKDAVGMACPICDKVLYGVTEMRLHLRSHKEEKPYECPLCRGRFKNLQGLQIHHSRKHDKNSLRFPCESCHKAFYNRHELEVHRRSHTGERPYACDICGSSFKILSNLNVHKRKHTGERPYACPIEGCSQCFETKNALSFHFRSHSAEEKDDIVKKKPETQSVDAKLEFSNGELDLNSTFNNIQDNNTLNNTIQLLAQAGAELHRQRTEENLDLTELANHITAKLGEGRSPDKKLSLGGEKVSEGNETEKSEQKKSFDLHELSELASFLANAVEPRKTPTKNRPVVDTDEGNLVINETPYAEDTFSTVDTSQLNVSSNFLMGIPFEQGVGDSLGEVCQIEEVGHTEEIASGNDKSTALENQSTRDESGDEDDDDDDFEDDEYFAQMDDDEEEEEEPDQMIDNSLEYVDDGSQPIDVAMQAEYDCNILDVGQNEEIITTTVEELPEELPQESDIQDVQRKVMRQPMINFDPVVKIERLDPSLKPKRKSRELSTFVKFDFSGGRMKVNKRTDLNDPKKASKTLKCNTCTFSTTNEEVFVKHAQKHEALTCVTCNATFHRKRELDAHMRSHAEEDKPFKCMECARVFVSEEVLSAHCILKHNKKSPLKKRTPTFVKEEPKNKTDTHNKSNSTEKRNRKLLASTQDILEVDHSKSEVELSGNEKVARKIYPGRSKQNSSDVEVGPSKTTVKSPETKSENKTEKRIKKRKIQPEAEDTLQKNLTKSDENPFAKPPKNKRLPAAEWLSLDSDIAQIKDVKHINKPYKCTQCPKSYPDDMQLQYHMAYHVPEEESPTKNIQGKQLTTRQQAVDNKKSNKRDKALKKIKHAKNLKASSLAALKDFSCDLCEKTFPLQRSLQIHKRVAHKDTNKLAEDLHKCLICQRSLPTEKSLKTHITKMHPGDINKDGDFVCKKCARTFPSKELLTTHQKSVHAPLDETSDESQATTSNKVKSPSLQPSKVLKKEANKEVVAIYKCGMCQKKFSSEKGLREHSRIKHGESNLTLLDSSPKVNKESPIFFDAGTKVLAKFKGSFCEATVKAVKKSIKCKVQYEEDNSTQIVGYRFIEGELKVNNNIIVIQGDARWSARIIEVIDNCTYTILFNDGDEEILKRPNVRLKGERKQKVKGILKPDMPQNSSNSPSSKTMKSGEAVKVSKSVPKFVTVATYRKWRKEYNVREFTINITKAKLPTKSFSIPVVDVSPKKKKKKSVESKITDRHIDDDEDVVETSPPIVEKVKGPGFACTSCPERFDLWFKLRMHILKVHSGTDDLLFPDIKQEPDESWERPDPMIGGTMFQENIDESVESSNEILPIDSGPNVTVQMLYNHEDDVPPAEEAPPLGF